VVFILCASLLIIQACKKKNDNITNPPVIPEKVKITLAADDTTCMEAWIKLSIENGAFPLSLKLTQDGSRKREFNLFQKDTVLYYDSLLPARNYTYSATLLSDTSINQTQVIRTMDTTSHNFTWKVYEFGDAINNFFYDVAVIDENNIWAVGYVKNYDSTGHIEDQLRNLFKWDGTFWKSFRATYGVNQNLSEMYSIFAFSANDVFLGNYTHWVGSSYFSIPVNIEFPTKIYGLWGMNWQDIIVVGVSGLMAHYNGTGWTKLPTLTDLFLGDIYGNAKNGNIYVVGGRISDQSGVVLEKENNNWKVLITGAIALNPGELFSTKLYDAFTSVWVDEKGKVYVAGGLAYQYYRGKWSYLEKLPLILTDTDPYRDGWSYVYSLRGNTSNDIMIAGELNTLQHFNGYTWKQIGPAYNSIDYQWRKVEMKGNTAVAVGTTGSKALVMILKR